MAFQKFIYLLLYIKFERLKEWFFHSNSTPISLHFYKFTIAILNIFIF